MQWHELFVAALAAIATTPLAFFFPGCLCCDQGCSIADGKPRTNPANEGTWVPSGTWGTGVTWTFQANPGDDSGETWFFYGSTATSNPGGFATLEQRQDWGNICNWYSSKTTSPSVTSGLPGGFDKRATSLPPESAVVHVYSSVSTSLTGPQTIKSCYVWDGVSIVDGELTATGQAHDSNGGFVFVDANNFGTLNGGATFTDGSMNVVNAGSSGIVNDGATFLTGAVNDSEVNGAATFYDSSYNDSLGVVNDGAVFNDTATNLGTINDGAVFNDTSKNTFLGTVNGGAAFNDAACSERTTGNFFATPCTRKFVAHPTDLPTCNGTAPDGCANSADTCGCG